MKRAGLIASIFGLIMNFGLFLLKVYVSISSNSLTIYCDAINNLGDTLSCIVGIVGFLLISKMSEIKSLRLQSLCTFVISIIISISGAYFVYNGMERVFYPLPVSYSVKYALLVALTIIIKIIMGIVYYLFNKKAESAVLKALVLDCVLDCFVTSFALMSLVLVGKINFAIDGIFAVVTGVIITASAIKTLIDQAKYLVNN